MGDSAELEQNQTEDSPAALLGQGRAKQNTLFLFRRIFWWCAQIRNYKECFAWRRALASGGGAASFGQEFLIK